MKNFGKTNNENSFPEEDDIFRGLDDIDASELDDLDLSDVDISDLDEELEDEDLYGEPQEQPVSGTSAAEDEEPEENPSSEAEAAEWEEEENSVSDDGGGQPAPEGDFSGEEDIFEDDEKRSPLKGIIITAAVLAAVIAVSVFIANTDTGFIGEFKDNLAYNLSNIEKAAGLDKIMSGSGGSEQNTSQKLDSVSFSKETNIIPFEDASSAQFASFGKYVIAAKSNYLAMYNRNGEIKWECVTSIVDPILQVNGRYILIAEKNGKKLCLYKDGRCLYSVDAQNNIVSASVSLTGDAVVVTKKDFYKGAFEAFNKNGARIYSWSSGKDYIVTAAISPSTRTIAVSLMNTDETVQSHVQLFDINRSQSHVTVNFGETVVFGLEFINSRLTAFSDCSICGLDEDGDLLWRHMYDNGRQFMSYSSDAKGNKLVLIDNNDKPELHVYTPSGKEKAVFNIEEFADSLGINGRLFIFNNNRTITFGRLTSPNQCAASMEIKGLYVLDEDVCMVVYNNSIEFIKA